jgi:aubergine-like protein
MNRARGGGQQGPQSQGRTRPLDDQMAAMAIGGGDAGDRRGKRDDDRRGERRGDDENYSSGHFDGYRIDPDKISGQMIKLYGNAINLYPQSKSSDANAFQYHVSFLPEVDHKNTRIALVKSQAEVLGGTHILYDGGSTLFTNQKVGNSDTIELEAVRLYDQQKITMCFSCKGPIFTKSPEFSRIMGLLMKKALRKCNLTQLGPHHFSPELAVPLRDGFNLWPGFTTGVNQYESGLMLVLNTTFKLAHTRTVMHAMEGLHQRSRGNNDAFQKECLRSFVGNIVVTTYNMKRYKVDDLDFSMNPASTFETKKGPVSFADYYKEKYDCTVRDMNQPLIISQPKKSDVRRGFAQEDQPILLIPELCIVTGLSDDLRNDFRFMREMATVTQQNPDSRARKLMDLVNQFRNNPEINDNFRFWHLEFDSNLVQFNGKKLKPVPIFMQGQRPVDYDSHMGDFQRSIRGKMRTPVNVPKYALFYVKQNEQTARMLSERFTRLGQGFGMQFGECVAQQAESTRTQDTMKCLRECQAQHNGSLTLCVFLLPDNSADRYNSIKKVCYVESPVASQCVLNKTLLKEKGVDSVVSKLLIQIAAKLGGEPWVAGMPDGFKAQIIGLDVHHPGKGVKGPAVVGVVASTNKTVSRWYSRCFEHTDEMVGCVKTAFAASVRKFKEINGFFPPHIIFFRDGVGEGQLATVQSNEGKQIEEALKDMECESKVCYVVVSKRIMQRFFTEKGGKLENPSSGTVVFDTLTKSNRYDFFLIPQGSRQGTVTPTHYNVLFDYTGMTNGMLMEIAFNLCHLYYNWTGALRVPAPCQYAHKLAFLAGQSLGGQEPSLKLAETLFYL